MVHLSDCSQQLLQIVMGDGTAEHLPGLCALGFAAVDGPVVIAVVEDVAVAVEGQRRQS